MIYPYGEKPKRCFFGSCPVEPEPEPQQRELPHALIAREAVEEQGIGE